MATTDYAGYPHALDKIISVNRPGFDLLVELETDVDEFSSDELTLDCDDEHAAAELEEDDVLAPQPRARRRKKSEMPHVVLPADRAPSVYEYLQAHDLVQKLTRIVLHKAKVPWHLKKDAEQAIHMAWAGVTVNPQYERNQVANYAYKSGESAALKLRREIGAAVVIPGALFRTGRDTPFARYIGAAVQPKDISDYEDSLELSEHHDIDYAIAPAITVEFLQTRLEGLKLSAKQRALAEMILVKKMTLDVAAKYLEMSPRVVERLLNQIVNRIYERDEAPTALPATGYLQ